MPSMDSSLDAFDRLNLNESDVISHLCSVAVEKCQSKAERRLAGCGGHHMRKRVLIKNFVSELMKKQQDLQSEEGMEEEEGEGEDGGEAEGDTEEVAEEREEEIELEEEDEEEEEEVDLNENMMINEKGRREEEEDETAQRASREWYHHHHSPYSHSDGGYSSPSPPLDDDEREKSSLWSLPVCTSPDSMALHLRDPYETREAAMYQSSDPYSFSSSFSLSPPSDDENSNMGVSWHDSDLSSSFLARPPSRLDCSPPYSLYDDLYSSCPSPSLPENPPIHHHPHYEMPAQLLDQSYDVSSIRVVAAGESDTAFLAMGGDRPLQEMRNYSSMVSWSCNGGDGVLFDLSSSSPSSIPSIPSSFSSPSTQTKKRKSEEMSPSLLVDDHSKRIKL